MQVPRMLLKRVRILLSQLWILAFALMTGRRIDIRVREMTIAEEPGTGGGLWILSLEGTVHRRGLRDVKTNSISVSLPHYYLALDACFRYASTLMGTYLLPRTAVIARVEEERVMRVMEETDG